MESTLTRRGLNGNQLKLIAITAMTIDHLAWTLWPGYSHNPAAIACHIIGRLTAPIMWFFIVEGYHYTHDVNKYTLRLFILALVSHFAYNFCFGISFVPLKDSVFNQTSVAWSLAWGLVLLRINDSKRLPHWLKAVIVFVVCAITFPSDWSCVAAVAILFMGNARGNFKQQMIWMMLWSATYAAVYFIFLDKIYGVIQLLPALRYRCCGFITANAASGRAWASFFMFIIRRTFYNGHFARAALGMTRGSINGII